MLRRLAKQVRRAMTPRRGKPAVGDIGAVAAVYDEVFENNPSFDTLDVNNAPKLKHVLAFARSIDGKVLDAGCGRGSVLRHMLENGVDAFGIELSPSACRMYLQGLPHENADIISKAGWSPFAGRRGRGAVVATYLRGMKIAEEGKPGDRFEGGFLPGEGA